MFKRLLKEKKSSIIGNWTELIFQSYAPETTQFLRTQKDRFSNPVGYIINTNAGKIFDELVDEFNIDSIRILLDEIIKIKAVQDFSPSEAVEFIFLLKNVVRFKLEEELKEEAILKEFLKFEAAVDQVALLAFNLYMESREKIYKIRVSEIKSALNAN